jgi:hypothetical protein
MVAFIGVTPDPVMFRLTDVRFNRALDINVGWDTGQPAVKGRVFRSLNGGAEVRLPGPDLTSGTRTEKILLGQTLRFVLRNAAGGQEIANYTVTTKKDPLAEYMTDPDLGFIFRLNVQPLVDTVWIAFETAQPAVPYLEVRRHDNGELADGWMGSGGFQKQHQRELNALGNGYPQDTTFDFQLVAMKDIGGGRIAFGSGAPHNPEIRGTFTTGSRTTTFFFDNIYVRNDGDPNSWGEFQFKFGVGDVVTRERLGPVESWDKDLFTGATGTLNKVITIDHAPRWMWVQVKSWEDDSFLGTGVGRPATSPYFAAPGSGGYEVADGSYTWVTIHIDTNDNASDSFQPFHMVSGNFSTAYNIYGRFQVLRRNGTAHHTGGIQFLGRRKVPPKRSRPLEHSRMLEHGRTEAVGRGAGHTSMSLGPTGAVFVRTYQPGTQVGYLADLGGEFRTPVTLVAAAHETLYVVGLNPRGEVVVQTLADDSQPKREWTNLGGAFTGSVTGVLRGRFVDLLASDAKGQIFHRTLPTDGSQNGEHWRRIGSGVRGAVTAVVASQSELAVFGLADDGRLLHRRHTFDGEWRPIERDDWQVLGATDRATASRGIIRAHWETETDLIVSAFVDDELAGALLWAGYPEPDGATDWHPVEAADDTVGGCSAGEGRRG